MPRSRILAIAAGVALAAGALVLHGRGPLPCSLPDGNCQTFSTDNAFNSSGAAFVTADDFTPASSGTVTTVCFWGAYVPDPDPDPLPADDFTVRYYQDDGSGFPGPLVAEFTGADLTVSGPADTGDVTGGGLARIFEYSVTHPGVSVSAGTCYWLEISNPTDGTAEWFWEWALVGEGNGWSMVDGDPPDGYDFSDAREQDLAFCLDVGPGDVAADCGPPSVCGEGSGPCDAPNATPGCEDPACCAAVCASLALCCLSPWSQACADVAEDLGCLEVLPEPCEAEQNCQVTDLLGHGGFNDDAAVGATSDLSGGFISADNFTPAVSGSINALCWWGFYFDFDAGPCPPGPGDDFTVTYYEDDGAGLPGSALASFSVAPTVTENGTHAAGTVFRFDASHADVAVTAGDCYWLEITNDLDGQCLWVWSTAPPGDQYSLQDDGTGGVAWDVADGENWDLSWCLNLPVADLAPCAPPTPMESCPPGDVELTQSDDPDTITALNSIACNAGSPALFNYANGFARSYDLAALPQTSGLDVTVECVQFGLELNRGGAFPVTVNLYVDTDGGAPTHPDTDLALLEGTDVLVPASVEQAFLTATFDPPVNVEADSTLVVELFLPDRNPATGGDRGGALPGSNALGQSGPSYIRAEDCSLPNYVDLAGIGFPDMHLVHRVIAGIAVSCPWDCGDGDGTVGTPDFLALLAEWGSSGACDFDGGNVGTTDFLELLANWGACP